MQNLKLPDMVMAAALLLMTAVSGPAAAQMVDLSTVPSREQVQLTIYNSEDLTLVRETRTIPVKEGDNPLQFSWANTLIDPTSVRIEFPEQEHALRVLDTRFPHDRDEVLYWNVQSEIAGEVMVQITYFTSGISWEADYELIAAADETAAHLTGYVTVNNGSGEDYADAEIRLVVGEINLVERIRDLARRGVIDARYLDVDDPAELPPVRRREAVADAMMAPPSPEEVAEPREVVKEGLSEYYIFTIEGRETVRDGWAKRLRSFEPVEPELRVQHRYRPQEYGRQLVKVYLFDNDEAAGLGNAPLPDGTMRLFQKKEEGLAYVGQQTIRYIPIGDEVELNTGPDPDVVLEQVTLYTFRDEIWFRVRDARELRRLGDDLIRRDDRDTVAGWNTHRIIVERIHNTHEQPIDVEIRRSFDGDVIFQSELDPQRHDFRTVQLQTTVEPRQRAELRYETITHEGANREHDRVRIEAGEVSPVPWMD